MIEVPSSPDAAVLVGDFCGQTPESLFEWLTQPEKLTKWWPETAEVDLRVGGKYRLLWPNPEWTIQGEYLAIEPGRHLAFSWNFEFEKGPLSEVNIWLDALEDGCRMAIWHTGYANETERSQLCEGWIHFGMRLMGIAGTEESGDPDGL